MERDGPEDDLGEPDVVGEREEETLPPDVDREREEETLENPASSSEDLSDGQLEDMVEDLHNLLFLHGPQPQVQGEGGAVRVEEQENAEDDEIVVDDLPPQYRYLRQLSYNQPRQPRKGDVVKYCDFNYDGWLRVRVTSKHKKSSKYAGSMNCVFLDIDREPDGLFFYSGDFWSILRAQGMIQNLWRKKEKKTSGTLSQSCLLLQQWEENQESRCLHPIQPCLELDQVFHQWFLSRVSWPPIWCILFRRLLRLSSTAEKLYREPGISPYTRARNL